jgi:hypothetical protein
MDLATRRNTSIRGLAGLIVVEVAASIGSGHADSRTVLRAQEAVTITDSGFSPHLLRIDAADLIPVWVNDVTVRTR